MRTAVAPRSAICSTAAPSSSSRRSATLNRTLATASPYTADLDRRGVSEAAAPSLSRCCRAVSARLLKPGYGARRSLAQTPARGDGACTVERLPRLGFRAVAHGRGPVRRLPGRTVGCPEPSAARRASPAVLNDCSVFGLALAGVNVSVAIERHRPGHPARCPGADT
jgi:hypothetical protein